MDISMIRSRRPQASYSSDERRLSLTSGYFRGSVRDRKS